MFAHVQTDGYSLFDQKQAEMMNRTGALLERGSVVAIDLSGTHADVVPVADFRSAANPDSQHPFKNAILPVAAAHANGWIFCIVAEPDGIPDGEPGNVFRVGDVIDVLVADGVAAGRKIAAGDGATAVAQAGAAATIGITLAAAPEGGGLTKCLFCGAALR